MLLLSFDEIADSVGGVAVLIVVILIMVFLSLFALKVGIQAVKGRNTRYGEVFITALIMWLINFVLIFIPIGGLIIALIALILFMLLIKTRHNTSFLGALGALIIALIILIVVIILLSLIFGFAVGNLFELFGTA